MINESDFILVPRPRECSVTGSGPALSTPVAETENGELPAEGFALDITADGVRLAYRDAAGRRYGRALLEQVRSQSDGNWPGLRVRDWPDYPVRGYMLDISRGRVPTRSTLENLVDLLELVRVNHFQLYTEHTFAYRDHETVWRDASPMTPGDIAWLDELCASRGIELVANQNCFGHYENWLKHEAYRHRAELPEGFELFGRHRPATTLAPTPDNADFALGLVDELVGHFRSDRVNIGCDETWELGRGASAAEVAERGKGRVYLDHLRRLADPLLAKGLDVQFWGDIITHHPELVPELPDGATVVAWDYEAPWAPADIERMKAAHGERFRDAGLDIEAKLDGFTSTVEPFTRAGYPFWVAPGTGTWRSLIGRLDTAYGNLLDTVQVGLSGGATGVLITDWGDNGHLQPLSVSYPPIVYGAALSWGLDANRDLDAASVLNRLVLGGTKLGTVLDALGRAAASTGQLAFNSSPFALALESDDGITAGEPDPVRVAALIDGFDAALNDLAAASDDSAHAAAVKRELTSATRLARHGGWRMLRAAGASAPGDAALRDDLIEAIALHRESWFERSRPGGIERGFANLDGLLGSYPTGT
ncbi:MAG TPA: family 20 glycosylhydrolase [Stackebrandtia sp.]|jgi:hypothetical protein|uniref:beta-N-acetylhexosaminidase n=1 Tax=Stackebrandtia sp. TaxID=2023065 RepID=UPI002D3CF3E3|nr:family 20 glycosylhydrolase [Stackebrandtia sp.]HZE37313.1 family 20 glycosylhydrolase [Stackebrandtia sp.]